MEIKKFLYGVEYRGMMYTADTFGDLWSRVVIDGAVCTGNRCSDCKIIIEKLNKWPSNTVQNTAPN